MHALLAFTLFTLSWPTPVTALAIAAAVYSILQAAKASPWLGQYITGWFALILNGALTVLAYVATVPSAQLYSWTTVTAIIITVLGGAGIHGSVKNLLQKPSNGNGPKAALFVLAALGLALAPSQARAQGIPVSGTTTAAVFHYQGASYAATIEKEGFTAAYFGATKDQSLWLGAAELFVPGQFNVYGPDINYQPNICPFLSKTTISCADLTISFDAFPGVATLATGNAFSLQGGANVSYNFSSNAAVTSEFGEGGVINGKADWYATVGLNLTPNPSASQSSQVKKQLRKEAAARRAYKVTE